ncbi:MAG: hypothetical protein KY476_24945, partial [Planctomycetes bacterium]|nr:hypothetical protein [Planctomycetota bacterium]
MHALAMVLVFAVEPSAASTDAIRRIDPDVFPASRREELAAMVRDDLRRRIDAANQRSSEGWRKIANREDWERFRDERLAALEASLGEFPPAAALIARSDDGTLKVRKTASLEGDGFQIENVVYESRPGLWVTANLYRPSPPSESMP